MQTALCLLAAAPPARAGILARHHRAGARHAANAGVVPIVEGVVGHLMLAHVRLYVVERPAHEGVDLDEAEAAIPADDRRAGALGRLVAPDRGDPRVVARQRSAQGLHLSELAAAIGVAAPELGSLVHRLLVDRVFRAHGADGDAVPVLDLSPQLVRLREEDTR